MLAVVYQENGELTVEELSIPSPKPGEVVIKVHNCGVCGSDLHLVQHRLLPYHSVMGHEFSGEITELGEGVENWKIGDRVVALPYMSCDDCAICFSGKLGCVKGKAIGLGQLPGGFAEYLRVQASKLFKIPDGVSYRDAAFTEPLAVGLHGVNQSGLREGQGCIIMGAGPVGISVLLWCIRQKTSILVSETNTERRMLLDKLFSIATVDPVKNNPVSVLAELTAKNAEVVFDCVGVPGTLQQAMEYTNSRGSVVVLGVCMSTDTISPVIGIMKELQVHFSLGYTRGEFENTLSAISSGEITVSNLVTDIVNIHEFPRLFKELMTANNKGKVLLEFN